MSQGFDHHDTPLPLDYFERKYHLSRVTLWRYRKAGLPAVTVGAKTFVRESQFLNWLESKNGQTVSPTPNKESVQ